MTTSKKMKVIQVISKFLKLNMFSLQQKKFKEINQQALVVFSGTTSQCMNAEYENGQFKTWLDDQIKLSKLLVFRSSKLQL